MNYFKKILKYAKPYLKYAYLNVLFNILYALFNVLSVLGFYLEKKRKLKFNLHIMAFQAYMNMFLAL